MTEPTGGTDRGRENGKWRDIFRYKDIIHNTKPLPGRHFHDRRAWYTVCVSLRNLQSWPFFHCLWDCKDCLPHDMLHLQMIAKQETQCNDILEWYIFFFTLMKRHGCYTMHFFHPMLLIKLRMEKESLREEVMVKVRQETFIDSVIIEFEFSREEVLNRCFYSVQYALLT